MAISGMTENITYQDFLAINSERRSSVDFNRFTILSVDFDRGQLVTVEGPSLHSSLHSIERFVYAFLTYEFIIENPEMLENYNFSNLRMYTNPEEFYRELKDFETNATLLGVDVSFNSFVIRQTFDGWEVTGYLDKDADVIILPDFITSIGAGAFSCLEKLQIAKLSSNTLKHICNTAFYGCVTLSQVYFPPNLYYIGDGAFYASGLKSVTVPNGITEITPYTFELCKSLENVVLPDTVKIINERAFTDSGLRNVEMPAVETIGKYAFAKTSMRGKLVLPSTLKGFYLSAFSFCTTLTKICIPESAEIYDNMTLGVPLHRYKTKDTKPFSIRDFFKKLRGKLSGPQE